jgi:drug/metabolite transporter (DMT)-like permease
MHQPFTLRNLVLLTLPPLLWAGNAVVGRLVVDMVPPITFNMLRWLLAMLLLMPLAGWVLRPRSALWTHWRRYGLLGLLSVGLYNALQYLALHTSTPVNVTLVASSMPMFMLAIGALFFGHRSTARQLLGAMLSMVGVLIVLSHGDPARLAMVQFVPGDLYMLLATAAWAWYSWLLTRTQDDDPAIRGDWAAFLMAQVVPGAASAALFAGGEWALLNPPPIQWGWPLLAALAYVTIAPAIVAYRCWGLAVSRMGPNVAGIFGNLSPLFAAILSAAILGELPHLYHGAAFALIVAGIAVSSRR